MCSLFQLLPGYTLPEEWLFNAVHNNEHGYGVLLKENKKIQVIKDLPAKPDPDKLFKLLKEHEDVERWVHLRNMSQGTITLDNVQPIQVYHSKKRDVFFLHNGTIGNLFVPENMKDSLPEKINTDMSDSRRYAISRIAPYLLRFHGNSGPADIHDPFLNTMLVNGWTTVNGRAVLVSSDQDHVLLNSTGWESLKDPNGEEFLSSNDDYFKILKRGSLFDQRKKEEDAKKAKNAPARILPGGKGADSSTGVYKLEYPPFEETLSLSEAMVDCLEEYDLYTPEGFVAMAYLEESELLPLFRDNLSDAVTMFLYLTSYLKDATIANEKLVKENAELLANQTKTKNDPVEIDPLNIVDTYKEQEVHVG